MYGLIDVLIDKLVFFLAIFVVIAFFGFLWVRFDLFLNRWLGTAAKEWRGYNYFTSCHALSILYLKKFWFWFALHLLISSFVYLVITGP